MTFKLVKTIFLTIFFKTYNMFTKDYYDNSFQRFIEKIYFISKVWPKYIIYKSYRKYKNYIRAL